MAAHSISEVYSVLTSAPFKPRLSPSTAVRLIEQNIKSEASVISLTKRDYFRLIEKMGQSGFKGSIVYDGIVVACAQKSKADAILTSNRRDFLRLIPDALIKVIAL